MDNELKTHGYITGTPTYLLLRFWRNPLINFGDIKKTEFILLVVPSFEQISKRGFFHWISRQILLQKCAFTTFQIFFFNPEWHRVIGSRPCHARLGK